MCISIYVCMYIHVYILCIRHVYLHDSILIFQTALAKSGLEVNMYTVMSFMYALYTFLYNSTLCILLEALIIIAVSTGFFLR